MVSYTSSSAYARLASMQYMKTTLVKINLASTRVNAYGVDSPNKLLNKSNT